MKLSLPYELLQRFEIQALLHSLIKSLDLEASRNSNRVRLVYPTTFITIKLS